MKKLFTILSLVLFLITPSSSVFAIEYGGIGGRPAYPDPDNPRTESIFIYQTGPGLTEEDGVVVINNTDEEKTLMVYITDTTPSSGGGFACKQHAEDVTEAGSWFTLSKSEVTIDGGKNEIVPFELNVPDTAGVGEHNACVVIQEKEDPSNEAGINLSVRSAIRAQITIPGEIVKDISIKSFAFVETENGKNIVRLELENDGNVSVDADTHIITKNKLTGEIVGETEGIYAVLRDSVFELNSPIDETPWGGLYESTVTVSYDRGGVEYIEEVTTAEDQLFLQPETWAGGVYLFILILILFILYLIVVMIKRKTYAKKEWVDYIVKDGDTIKSIAEVRNERWRFLAKVNKIKAPYTVSEGEKLKVPPSEKVDNENEDSENPPSGDE